TNTVDARAIPTNPITFFNVIHLSSIHLITVSILSYSDIVFKLEIARIIYSLKLYLDVLKSPSF
ncbi:hypothetical protein, partial [Streptococcus pyogenes]|uniref:hypothetical protein n=1 Tax=Streptococcus pyogenes TaxID=1314 RepID=UPI001F34B164